MIKVSSVFVSAIFNNKKFVRVSYNPYITYVNSAANLFSDAILDFRRKQVSSRIDARDIWIITYTNGFIVIKNLFH